MTDLVVLIPMLIHGPIQMVLGLPFKALMLARTHGVILHLTATDVWMETGMDNPI